MKALLFAFAINFLAAKEEGEGFSVSQGFTISKGKDSLPARSAKRECPRGFPGCVCGCTEGYKCTCFERSEKKSKLKARPKARAKRTAKSKPVRRWPGWSAPRMSTPRIIRGRGC